MRAAVVSALAVLFVGAPASAEKSAGSAVVLAALDKVTARIQPLEIAVGKTVQFGTLRITPRVCFARPPTEPPLNSTFLEIDDVQVDGSVKRVFTGWMFAESPGLHALEHPVFDLWLTACKTVAPSAPVASRPKSPTP